MSNSKDTRMVCEEAYYRLRRASTEAIARISQAVHTLDVTDRAAIREIAHLYAQDDLDEDAFEDLIDYLCARRRGVRVS